MNMVEEVGIRHRRQKVSPADEREETMQINVQKIIPCLWFDDQAEEAAKFYTSIFKNSKLGKISRYGKEGYEIHGKPEGSVMVVEFELSGQTFTALNGGPIFKFNEAISFQVNCDTQEEIDYFWEKLGEGGDEAAQQCGWLKDKYGVSWQIIPKGIDELVGDPGSEKSQRAMKAMLQMKKIDMGKIKNAYEGQPLSFELG
jgi:predicted 3-demethylubiquinone-9 3-methyltransferase (glyoxalase superfamily)